MTNEQALGIAQEKGNLIKEALLIIEELSKSPIADVDGDPDLGDEIFKLQTLIIKARTIRNNHWWPNKFVNIKNI